MEVENKTADTMSNYYGEGELNFKEAREAYNQLYDSSDDRRKFTLRMLILYAFNDEHGRGNDSVPTKDDLCFFQENCMELIKMDYTNDTLRAELYREIGEFEKCISLLDSLDPTGHYEASVREQIREHAVQKDCKVFEIQDCDEA